MLQIKSVPIYKLFFITLFFIILSGKYTNGVAQKNDNYNWFYITIQEQISTETNTKLINITNVGDSIESGTFCDFVKKHYNNLKNGKITIGPFENYEDAQLSKKIYTNLDGYNTEVDEDKDFYMFFVKPFKTGDTSFIGFENIPARVTLCSKQLFSDIMMEGFNFDKLAIGPFPKYELAEKAKYTFLRSGRYYLSKQEDSLKAERLNAMLKKWEELKIRIVSKKNKSMGKENFYRFTTRFHKKYFQPNAIQVMLISPVYKNINESNVHGISLQGSEIKDNNRVIAFDENTKYSEMLHFNTPKNTEIQGFTARGFVYNQSSLVELPKKYVKLKR